MADAPKKPIDLVSIQWATIRAWDRRDWFVRVFSGMRNDSEKSKRLEVHECLVCYYSTRPRQHTNRRIVDCGICRSKTYHYIGLTAACCTRCAKKYKLCSHCGGTIDLRERRKFEVEEPSK